MEIKHSTDELLNEEIGATNGACLSIFLFCFDNDVAKTIHSKSKNISTKKCWLRVIKNKENSKEATRTQREMFQSQMN